MGRRGTAYRAVPFAGPRAGRRATFEAAPPPAGRRRRTLLSFLAVTAVSGIALVSVIDPYAGATAAPYFQEPVLASSSGVQRYDVDGGYVLLDPSRGGFHAESDAGSGDDGAVASSAGLTATPVGTAQVYAAKAVAKRGWAPSEFACLVKLWNRESGWNTHAANPSGAYGIPQALPGSKMGAGWQDDYRVQIDWGVGYISGGYGSPCGALAHSDARGWY